MKHFNNFLLVLLSFILLFFLGCQSQYITAGKIYIDQENYDAAIDQFKKAVEAEPQNPETYIWLGKAYAYRKLYEEACKQTEKGISLDPKKIDALKKDISFNYWAVFFNAGMKHVDNKEFDLALKRIERSLDFEPKSAQSLNYLAYCFIKLKRDDDAEKTYKKTIELVPDNVDTYVNLASFYRISEKKEEEEAILKKARKIVENPDWLKVENEDILKQRKKEASMVYIELGNVLLRHEKPEEAEKVLKKAMELSPEDKDVNFNYGVALYELNKYMDAVIPFKKVVLLDSLDKEGYYYLGAAYLKAEKYNDAIEACTKLLEIDPEYCEAYINRAYAQRELGNTDAAYEDAEIGIECQKRRENK